MFSATSIYHFANYCLNDIMTNTINDIRRINLIRLIDETGLKKGKFAEKVDTAPAYISQIISEKTDRNMGDDLARKIEISLGKPRGWMDVLHDLESDYRAANIDRRTKHGFDNTEPGPDIIGDRVPLISSVMAGGWCEAIDLFQPGDADEWMLCPSRHGVRTYALRVVGDSMTSPYPGQRSYPEGTIIFVDPDRAVTSGCRVIAKQQYSEDVTFKEYREEGGKRFLRPLNPQYPMIEMDDNTRLCGRVIGKWDGE